MWNLKAISVCLVHSGWLGFIVLLWLLAIVNISFFTTSCWFLLSVLPVKDIDSILDVIVNLFFIAVEIPISTVLD